MTKYCNGCKTDRPLTDFFRRAAAPDGLKPRCKECGRAEERARFHANPEKTKAKTAAIYARTREVRKAKRDAWRAENPRKKPGVKPLPKAERIARAQASRKKTYEKNKAKVLATAARYRAANKDKERANRKAHYERNKERVAETTRAYRQANKGKVNAWQKTYQTRKRQALPPWADLQKIAEIYETAAWLTETSGESWHVDHIVPLQGKTISGLHCEGNLTILPASENISKSNRWWPNMWEPWDDL